MVCVCLRRWNLMLRGSRAVVPWDCVATNLFACFSLASGTVWCFRPTNLCGSSAQVQLVTEMGQWSGAMALTQPNRIQRVPRCGNIATGPCTAVQQQHH